MPVRSENMSNDDIKKVSIQVELGPSWQEDLASKIGPFALLHTGFVQRGAFEGMRIIRIVTASTMSDDEIAQAIHDHTVATDWFSGRSLGLAMDSEGRPHVMAFDRVDTIEMHFP